METENTSAWQAMAARVERLERRNRRLTRGLVALALAAGAAVLCGTAFRDAKEAEGRTTRTQTLEAEQVVIRDSDGQMRAWLGLADGGPRLLLFDKAGQQRVGVGLSGDAEAAIGVFDGAQKPRVILGMVDGWPGLVLRDESGRKRAALQSQARWSSLFFYDGREVKRSGIGAFEDGAALNLCDARGRDRVGLTTEPAGSSLSFLDAAGHKRLALGLVRDDLPALGGFDEGGRLLASLKCGLDGSELSLYGTNLTEATILTGGGGAKAKLLGPGGTTVWKAP